MHWCLNAGDYSRCLDVSPPSKFGSRCCLCRWTEASRDQRHIDLWHVYSGIHTLWLSKVPTVRNQCTWISSGRLSSAWTGSWSDLHLLWWNFYEWARPDWAFFILPSLLTNSTLTHFLRLSIDFAYTLFDINLKKDFFEVGSGRLSFFRVEVNVRF